MGILTRWRIMGLAAVLAAGVAAARVHAASSSATAQIIVIVPPRDTPSGANDPSAPDAFLNGLPAPMERTTTVVHDGDAVIILHTAVEPF